MTKKDTNHQEKEIVQEIELLIERIGEIKDTQGIDLEKLHSIITDYSLISLSVFNKNGVNMGHKQVQLMARTFYLCQDLFGSYIHKILEKNDQISYDIYINDLFAFDNNTDIVMYISKIIVDSNNEDAGVYLEKIIDKMLVQEYMSKLKRPDFFDAGSDVLYTRTFKPVVEYFISKSNSEAIEKVSEFNSSFKWYKFIDLKIRLAEYYYFEKEDLQLSGKYIQKIIENDCWVGSGRFRRLLMDFYNHNGQKGGRDLLIQSYEQLMDNINKGSMWQVYDLLRDLLNVSGDPNVYSINENTLFNKIISHSINRIWHDYNEDFPLTGAVTMEIQSHMYPILVEACDNNPSAKDITSNMGNFVRYLSNNNFAYLEALSHTTLEGVGRLSILDIYKDDIPDKIELQTEDVQQIIFILFEILNDIYIKSQETNKNIDDFIHSIDELTHKTELYINSFGDVMMGPHMDGIEADIKKAIKMIEEITRKSLFIDLSEEIRTGIGKSFALLDIIMGDYNPENKYEKLLEQLYMFTNDMQTELQDYKTELNKFYVGERSMLLNRILLKLIPFYNNRLGKEKAEERDKVLADVSHKIKGLIHSIQTPLGNMLEWVEDKQQIKNAINGTTLISDLVNMASHSYSASIDDFYYDARNNKDGITLETILVDSIKLAIPHMFDGKNYNKQNRNYFKTKEEHIEAKNEFQTIISDCNQIGIIKKYLNKYFFKIKIEISGIKKHSIGFDRETPTKLIILYTELILNALKNVSYLDKNQREVSISIGLSDDLKFSISNSYNKRRKVKTTGLGKYFVVKMVEAINGKCVFIDNNIYTAEIILPNLWEKQ